MGCQSTQALHRCIASHVLLLLQLLVVRIIALRSNRNDGCSIRNVGLQKITLMMKETSLYNTIFFYLLFYVIFWSVFVFCMLYWNSTSGEEWFWLFPPTEAIFLWVLHSHLNILLCILFCLPTSTAQHPFQAHSLVSNVWALEEAQLGIEHVHFPVEQRWLGWTLDPSGKEAARQGISSLYSERVLLDF